MESIHYGSIAVVTSNDNLVAWYGNPQTITFLRSTAKPFQILPLIENGGREKFGLTPKEIALICASHSGTDEHKAVVESIQAKTGVLESDLLCGIHQPLHRVTADEMALRGEKPTPNRHNCSGKHTGMVAYARLGGHSYQPGENAYINFSHPIQVEILSVFAQMSGLKSSDVHVGVDGCSAPNFAVPLRNTALGYARLCDPTGLTERRRAACQTITQAMMANPFMVGGPGSFDTALMEVTQGRIISKGGAEGFQGMGVMPGAISPASPAMGIAFKISDGDYRNQARSAIALEILRQLNLLSESELSLLKGFGPSFTLTNFRKIEIGQGLTSFRLKYPINPPG